MNYAKICFNFYLCLLNVNLLDTLLSDDSVLYRMDVGGINPYLSFIVFIFYL